MLVWAITEMCEFTQYVTFFSSAPFFFFFLSRPVVHHFFRYILVGKSLPWENNENKILVIVNERKEGIHFYPFFKILVEEYYFEDIKRDSRRF